MVIAPTPPKVTQGKITELIQKGGSVTGERKDKKRSHVINMVLSQQMLNKIDEQKEYNSCTRVAWIRQAIIEKLEKE